MFYHLFYRIAFAAAIRYDIHSAVPPGCYLGFACTLKHLIPFTSLTAHHHLIDFFLYCIIKLRRRGCLKVCHLKVLLKGLVNAVCDYPVLGSNSNCPAHPGGIFYDSHYLLIWDYKIGDDLIPCHTYRAVKGYGQVKVYPLELWNSNKWPASCKADKYPVLLQLIECFLYLLCYIRLTKPKNRTVNVKKCYLNLLHFPFLLYQMYIHIHFVSVLQATLPSISTTFIGETLY